MREELSREEILRRRREWRERVGKTKKKKKPKRRPPRKRGPKPKKKDNRAHYKIFVIVHNRQKYNLGWFKTRREAYDKWNELIERNKSIVFPMRYQNYKRIQPVVYELLMIKRREDDDPEVARLRNEYGEYVDHEINLDDWIVFDKGVYEVEETFWVYGYHPRYQRKDFMFIFSEFVEQHSDDPMEFNNICVYRNKVLFEHGGKLDMVMCKNESDAIRLYNQVEDWCRKRKYRYVAFGGDMAHSRLRKEYEAKIVDLTNWNLRKVNRASLRP